MKDFIGWHKIKKGVEQKEIRINFQIRDIFSNLPLLAQGRAEAICKNSIANPKNMSSEKVKNKTKIIY